MKLFIVGLIVFLGALFLALRPNPPKPQPAPIPTPPASSWQIYSNPKYKFQFNYPDSIFPKQAGLDNQILFTTHSNAQDLSVIVIDNQPLDSYVAKELSSAKNIGENVKQKVISNPNISGKTIEYSSQGITFKLAYIKSPNSSSIIELGVSSGANSFNYFNQILSSFRFLDKPSFSCPASGYVDCLPKVDTPPDPHCQPDYLTWAKSNCPGFKGAAY